MTVVHWRNTSRLSTHVEIPRGFDAAAAAALRGWPVFPLSPRSKIPAVKRWETVATTDRAQLEEWWSTDPNHNVGIACGPAGLVVIDLDEVRGVLPPQWAPHSVRHGREALALLAEWAGEPDPVETFTVLTPHGEHRYFLAPTDRQLRNTVGATGPRGLGPAVDVRAWGGAVTAAGSVRLVRGRPCIYRHDPRRPAEPVPLPDWLITILTPPPPQPHEPILLRFDDRLHAYVAAAVSGEAANIINAEPGTRAIVTFRAAYKLGGLVGAHVLDEHLAENALLDAARVHDGMDGWTPAEARRHIENGIARGREHPRPIDGLTA